MDCRPSFFSSLCRRRPTLVLKKTSIPLLIPLFVCLFVCLFVSDKPSTQLTDTVVYSWIGHHTEVVCEAHGSPSPTLLWSRNGTVNESRVSETEVKSTLMITPANRTDFGLYTCTAQNLLGITFVYITVKELGKIHSFELNI